MGRPPRPSQQPDVPEALDQVKLLDQLNRNLDSSRQRYDWKSPDGLVTIPIWTVNMVFTCQMETTINLPYVVRRLSFMGPQLNRKKFPAVVVRHREPTVATLLFAQGKVVCTGAKSKEQARYAILGVLNDLKKIGYRNARIKSGTFVRQNHVFSGTFPWPVDIASLCLDNSAYCTYEPELFPGAIMRRPDVIDKKTVLTFCSGNFVITGGKCGTDALAVMDVIYPMVAPYSRKKDVIPEPNPFIKPVAPNNELVRTEARRKRKTLEKQQQDKKVTKKQRIEGEQLKQEMTESCPMGEEFVVPEDTKPSISDKKRTIEEDGPVVISHMPDLRNLSLFFSGSRK